MRDNLVSFPPSSVLLRRRAELFRLGAVRTARMVEPRSVDARTTDQWDQEADASPRSSDAARTASRRTLPLRSQAGIAWGEKERGGDELTVTPATSIAQITLDGNAVPQASRAQRVALSILQGEHLYDVVIGSAGMGHDLTHESCLTCGGFFPKVGEVRYSAVFHGYLHVGCVVDAASWAHPLVPFRHCSDLRCVDGWTTKVDDSYGSLRDPEAGALTLVRCPLCGGAA